MSGKPNVAIQASDNNMIAHLNECNFVPSGYNDTFYFNYRTTGSNGSLSYRMCAASPSLANVTANQYYAESDRRLKKNIKSFDNNELTDLFNVSDKLFKSFTWKRTNKLSCGLISQQLEKYIPESIEELNPKDKKQKYYSVNYQVAYAKIIASLVNEIKQMKEYYESKFKSIEEIIQKMQA